jgi:hypothetical protein
MSEAVAAMARNTSSTDWWAQLLDGFLGAIVAAVVGALVAIYVVRQQRRAERRAAREVAALAAAKLVTQNCLRTAQEVHERVGDYRPGLRDELVRRWTDVLTVEHPTLAGFIDDELLQRLSIALIQWRDTVTVDYADAQRELINGGYLSVVANRKALDQTEARRAEVVGAAAHALANHLSELRRGEGSIG